MKSLSLLCLCVASGLALAQTPPAPAPDIPGRLDRNLPQRSGPILADRIVAVVNDEVITLLELRERLGLVTKQLQRQGTQLPDQPTLEKQLLERMITDLVLTQQAKETGVRIDDLQLDRTVARIAEENGLSLDGFRAKLEADGISFKRFRDDIRNELTVSRLREREVDAGVTVTDPEVDAQLTLLSTEAAADTEYRLAHVLVTVPEGATSEQIEARRKKAITALSELRQGSEFGKVAASYSDAPDGVQGGVVGWRQAGRLPNLFLDALATLQPGDVSNVIQSPNGFHILKLLDKRGKEASASVPETRVRHILIKTSDTVNDTEAKIRLERLRTRITAGEDFATLAKANSDDGSAQKGGDLGWIAAGDTVPEFERVVNATRDGELAQPFKTQFGWHLLQVVERKNNPVSEDRRRNQARAAIRSRKSDELYVDWVRQLRDRAFVENRLEEK